MIAPFFDLVFQAGKIAPRVSGVTDHLEPFGLVDLDNDEICEAWLNDANRRYRREAVPPKRRPFDALLDYTREKNGALSINSPAASRVFEWFKQRSVPEAHYMGPLFTGSFFYDAYFWPTSIGIGFGKFKLDAFEALGTMPRPLKLELANDPEDLRIYLLYWADCVDYAYGFADIRKSNCNSPRAFAFLTNADKELRGAIAQANQPRPNPRAAMGARMAIEIFFKTLLVAKADFNDSRLKKLGHDLVGICSAVQQNACDSTEVGIVRNLVHTLPEISDRYIGGDLDLPAVGSSLSLCQVAATAVIRQLTGRDIRPQLFERREEN
jgi:hypothetical protein